MFLYLLSCKQAMAGDVRELLCLKQQVVGGSTFSQEADFEVCLAPKSVALCPSVLGTFPDKLGCLIPLVLKLSHTSPKNAVE